jgi:hypothetical protein
MSKYILLFMLSLFAGLVFGQSKDCLKYEPNMVSVTGIVERDTFPGHPNYESIKAGDEPEVYWILKLSKPVCVTGKPNDDLNESEKNIIEMQLVLTEAQYKEFHNFIGKKVIINGTLFHGITAHHKTTVLIKVEKMVAA